ncbi:toxin-antitoxin system YwqK family antitoxin [Mesonia sp. K7]|uniref:toxin-antitoxin system YwqK family antitoxin n=1 Tax=Mesonia sp. K7 TaxID=2218606 RepID=UPI001F1AAB8A|nr:nicotinic acid mononucleotide adenyltransferase [Mesonia sp. K7]
MKNLLCIAALLIGSIAMAQEVKPKFEKSDDLIKGTYYYEDGTVKQEGTYNLEGKLHGDWVMYNQKGEKTAVAKYQNGEKAGKWLFWENQELTEVNYNDSRITEVVKWKNNEVIVSNP